MITTFSNTVVITASLADVASGQELGVALSGLGAAYGLGIILTMPVEPEILQLGCSLHEFVKFKWACLLGLAWPVSNPKSRPCKDALRKEPHLQLCRKNAQTPVVSQDRAARAALSEDGPDRAAIYG